MDKEQLSKLMMALDEMAGLIAQIKEAVPSDAAAEEADMVDEATVGEEAEEADDSQLKQADSKDVRKAAQVQMLKRSLPAV